MAAENAVWKALADPTRRAILDLLADGPKTTGDLCSRFDAEAGPGIGRTGVLKHIEVLHAAGLVVARREGRVRWNFLNPVPIQQVADRWVGRHVRSLATSLQRLKALSEDRPVAARPTGPIVDDRPAAPLDDVAPAGESFLLEPVDAERDAADLFACSHGSPADEAVWTYMGYGPFADEASMATWLRGCADSSDPRFLTVRDRSDGRPVGMVAYLAIAEAHRRVEIGHIWYGRRAHRTAANTETAYLLLREAFARGYRRVEWKCDALNQRSCEAALRLGFTFEGIFRRHLIVKRRSRDTAWFSMLEEEWEAARPAFETWLAWRGADRPSLTSLRTA